MRTRIYQINTERDESHLKFLPFQESPVDASVYDEVFNAELPTDNLEEVFRRFNMESHFLFRGHSLSVSDVVVNENGAFYCDDVGFKKIEFDEAKAQKQDNLMRVVYVEPHMPAYEAEIVDTLEGEQKAVGGYIEPVYLSDDICVIGNEEAKLIGMEGNRRLFDGQVIMAGPFFVCGCTDDGYFRSLTDEETQRYLKEFAVADDISTQEVEANTGFTIFFSN